MTSRLALVTLLAFASTLACDDPGSETPALTAMQLLVPEACSDCHPEHYADWSASMHAQATDDPVFQAMNARAVEAGAGDFCITCHAPMAVRTGASDGVDLDAIPRALRGVTCAFCHQVSAVSGAYNNPLEVTLDGVMRGGIRDPRPTGAHASAYSPLHDRREMASSVMCGSCHDVVNGHGLALERTFDEWRASIFGSPDPLVRAGCGDCHMRSRVAPVATEGPERRLHGHMMPGVDVHLTSHPDAQRQRDAVQAELAFSVRSRVCVRGGASGAEVFVELTNIGAGHGIPSGAGHYRRMWVELRVEGPDGSVLLARDLGDDDAWVMREVLLDEAGEPTDAPWAAIDHRATLLLPPGPGARAGEHVDHPQLRRYGVAGEVARAELTVKLRPMPADLLESLVASGEIAPDVPGRAATFTVTDLVWTAADAAPARLPVYDVEVRCVSR